MTPTSFISERTAELILIPHLKMQLEKHFRRVVPMFPWLNRETSRTSKNLHIGLQFKVLAVFPRRPKFTSNDKYVYVTVNHDLLTFTEFAGTYGMPVVAACPIVTNLWELSSCTNIAWLPITEKTTESYLNFLTPNPRDEDVSDRLRISDIIELIAKSCEFDIFRFADFLAEAKHAVPRHYFFGPRYRPTYLIIQEEPQVAGEAADTILF